MHFLDELEYLAKKYSQKELKDFSDEDWDILKKDLKEDNEYAKCFILCNLLPIAINIAVWQFRFKDEQLKEAIQELCIDLLDKKDKDEVEVEDKACKGIMSYNSKKGKIVSWFKTVCRNCFSEILANNLKSDGKELINKKSDIIKVLNEIKDLYEKDVLIKEEKNRFVLEFIDSDSKSESGSEKIIDETRKKLEGKGILYEMESDKKIIINKNIIREIKRKKHVEDHPVVKGYDEEGKPIIIDSEPLPDEPEEDLLERYVDEIINAMIVCGALTWDKKKIAKMILMEEFNSEDIDPENPINTKSKLINNISKNEGVTYIYVWRIREAIQEFFNSSIKIKNEKLLESDVDEIINDMIKYKFIKENDGEIAKVFFPYDNSPYDCFDYEKAINNIAEKTGKKYQYVFGVLEETAKYLTTAHIIHNYKKKYCNRKEVFSALAALAKALISFLVSYKYGFNQFIKA